MINIEDKINKLVDFFKSNKNIVAVYIIGSYGTENQREDSDIDIALLFENEISIMNEMNISCDISDIIGYGKVDTIDLKKAPITLQFKAIKEGRCLYEADYIAVSDYIEYVLNRYRDEKYYLESFMKDYYEGFNFGGN